ncbi:MAG: hypothetical protein U0361_12205 [Nitrospiraceae bacterium]
MGKGPAFCRPTLNDGGFPEPACEGEPPRLSVFSVSDFDDGLGALVQQSKDLVIDPVDFCPMPLQIV